MRLVRGVATGRRPAYGARVLRSNVDDILGPAGALSLAEAGFEVREGQRALAAAVAHTLDEGGVLLAEAGTGTGKTLAYLAGAVAAGRRVVISTATRTLQDQIVRKDIPRLQAALGQSFVAALLKGRQNYLCLHRLEAARGLPKSMRPRELPRVEAWAASTTSGDRAELGTLPEDHPLWDALTTTSETCLGGRCPLFSRCWVTRARSAAEAAEVIVVNHHLYFGDAAVRASGGELLPRHDAVIFDEAHAVPEIAAQFFGRQVSTQRLNTFAQDLRTALDAAPGFPERLEATAALHAVTAASELLFMAVRPAGTDSPRVPWNAESGDAETHRRHLALDSALLVVEERLTAAGDAPGFEPFALLRQRAATLRDDLALLLDPRTPGWVFFREARGAYVALSGQPIEAAEPLRRHVLGQVASVVFTSATLTVGGTFDFVRQRLGLNDDDQSLEERPVTSAVFPSPFDFDRQARLYLPTGLPPPDAPPYADALAEHILALTRLTAGRAFVLFTSHRALDAMHARLRHTLAFPLLKQGDAPRTTLIERFRETPGAVLFGTSTFWEGVDVAGEALSLVIIDKLPFESPGDPVLQARLEQCRERGGNPFTDTQIPAAALALKQGFGRLIRTRADRGIVAVMDARLTTKGYGKKLLASLPPAPVVRDMDSLTMWWLAGNPGGTPN
jgi:ATP-dependent DNA helicase DinG